MRKRIRLPDHSRIFGTVKPDKDNEFYGLVLRNGRYQLLYYDENNKTKTLCLYTANPTEAKKQRDTLYSRAAAQGRGGMSAMQRRCEGILRDPKSDVGLKYMVYLNHQTVACDSLAEARFVREKICREVLGGAKK